MTDWKVYTNKLRQRNLAKAMLDAGDRPKNEDDFNDKDDVILWVYFFKEKNLKWPVVWRKEESTTGPVAHITRVENTRICFYHSAEYYFLKEMIKIPEKNTESAIVVLYISNPQSAKQIFDKAVSYFKDKLPPIFLAYPENVELPKDIDFDKVITLKRGEMIYEADFAKCLLTHLKDFASEAESQGKLKQPEQPEVQAMEKSRCTIM